MANCVNPPRTWGKEMQLIYRSLMQDEVAAADDDSVEKSKRTVIVNYLFVNKQ